MHQKLKDDLLDIYAYISTCYKTNTCTSIEACPYFIDQDQICGPTWKKGKENGDAAETVTESGTTDISCREKEGLCARTTTMGERTENSLDYGS